MTVDSLPTPSKRRDDHARRSSAALCTAAACLVLVVVWLPTSPARADSTTVDAAGGEQPAPSDSAMSPADAVVLGVVEGATEFLPVSSTGHLIITQAVLGTRSTDSDKGPADAYAIAVQAGAVLAVLLLYRRRLAGMALGLAGRDEVGRRTLGAVALAVAPAVVAGVVLESFIKDRLLAVGPVLIAWFLGGVIILLLAPRLRGVSEGVALEQMSHRQALMIGVAQCVALWPGTSRSLVTILAALAVGLSMAAAVEFSFLVGFVTLGAATLFEGARDGRAVLDAYGWVTPTLGVVVAFLAAACAIRWMVGYLQTHSLAIFGWYRLGVAGVVAVLLLTGVIST